MYAYFNKPFDECHFSAIFTYRRDTVLQDCCEFWMEFDGLRVYAYSDSRYNYESLLDFYSDYVLDFNDDLLSVTLYPIEIDQVLDILAE